jgi:hemerythrin
MLVWSEQFATGVALVDTQHKMLIDKINQLEALLKGPPPPKEKVDELLNFLGSYVGSHFKYEEGCMERARCPAHEKNKAAHAAFLDLFGKFKARYLQEGPKPELLNTLQQAAANWITGHILTIDMQLKAGAKP